MKKFLSLLILLISINSIAQGEANVWYFGHNAGLDFNTIPPTALTDGQINTFEGCSSFSDASGNLLFYSDGTTVWDRTHTPMLNGTGLAGDSSSTQSAMIIPRPGSTTEYYIFTVGARSSGNAGFHYYTIDMSLNGGFGDVNSSAIDLMDGVSPTNWSEKVAAVKGNDCETYWVLSVNQNEFFAYKITSTGVASSPIRSTVPYFSNDPRGYLKISPNGKKIGIAHSQVGSFMIYDFDDVTGLVSNELRLPMPNIPGVSNSLQPNQPYGVEFSPNSEKIYVHASNGGPFADNSASAHYSSLIQFDVSLATNADILASQSIIDAQNMYRGALQLGPDHKIYRSISQSYQIGLPNLGVIENPNESGAAVNYQHNAISLSGNLSSQGLPPFIASIFSSIELTSDDGMGNLTVINDQTFNMCTGDNLTISSESITGTATYDWYKDGAAVPFSSAPNLTFPSVSPTDNGVYKLVVEQTDPCGNSNTLEGEFTLEINDIPIAASAPPILICDDDNNDSYPFDLTQNDATIINGQAGTEVLYFSSQADADSGTSPITSPFSSGSTTIFGRLQNTNNPNCYDTTSFNIELYDSPFPTDIATMTSLIECDNTTVGTLNDGLIVSDLTVKETEILNGQLASDFSLSYFSDTGYSVSITTPNAFANTVAGGQTIYVRVTNVSESSCFTDTAFDLEVFNTPIAAIAPTMILCDDDNNGTIPFMLTDQDALINTDAGMTITHHPTQADADANSNAISSPFESGTTTIYARVENDLNTSCFDTSFFDIEVYESAFPLDAASITPITDCDNTTVGSDADGFIIFDLTQNETAILNGQSTTDFTLTYFTAADYNTTSEIIAPTTFTNTVVGGQTIYVRMTNNLENSCYTDTSFEIEVFELPVLNTPPFVLEQCDDDFDGFNEFNLTQINSEIVTTITSEVFTYYESLADANAGSSPITNELNYPNQIANIDNTVWVRIENDNACFRVTQIELVVKPSAIPTTFLEGFYQCDDGIDTVETTDGVATFDFSSVTAQVEAIFPVAVSVHYYQNEADATSEVNEIADPSSYRNTASPGMQEIWVRAESALGNDCLGNGHHVTLYVNPLPEFDVDPEAIVCLNLPPITLETYNPNGVYTYEWTNEAGAVISNNPTAQVASGGIYTVVATSIDNCKSLPRTVEVSESVIATIELEDITVVDDSDNSSITIDNTGTNLGIGNYEFALDDGQDGVGFYQDNPYFDNVAPGIRTVYVRDKNGCGVAEIEVAVIGFPRFFTPNNDGENDTWQIKGVSADFFSSSIVYIFDRYGKLIAQIDPSGDGWDGYYNGNSLPSTDYWFTAQLIDQSGNIRNRKGNFSLIRR